MKCCVLLRCGRLIIQFVLLVGIFVVPFVGCSGADGGRRKITGEISFNSQPLEGGWIYFRPVGKGPSAAGHIREGSFEIPSQKGLPAGAYKVVIEYQKPTGRLKKVYTGELIEEMHQVIPPKFNARSNLTADIQARGANHLTFDLTSN